MPPTRETVASIKKKYRSKLPKTIDVLSVLFDEQAKESRVVLNCNFHGEQDPVTLGYLRKTKFFCVDCGNESKGQSTGNARYSKEALSFMRQKRLEKWLEKSREIHGEKFSYFSVEKKFNTMKKPKVLIYCNEHKINFPVLPDKHHTNLFGGCPECEKVGRFSSRIKIRENSFLDWFENNRSERLKIVSNFKGMTNELTVFCNIHKKQKDIVPSTMMLQDTYGCDDCSSEARSKGRRLDSEKLLTEFSNRLPDGITIKEIFFDENMGRTMTVVNCKIHGIQNPVTLTYLRNTQTYCKECGYILRGFPEDLISSYLEKGVKGRPTLLGVMKMNIFGISTLKVGITSRTLESRYGDVLNEILYSKKFPELDAIVLENRIKLNFSKFSDKSIIKAGMRHGKRWQGDTECYYLKSKELIIDYCKSFELSLRNEPPDYEFEKSRTVIPRNI